MKKLISKITTTTTFYIIIIPLGFGFIALPFVLLEAMPYSKIIQNISIAFYLISVLLNVVLHHSWLKSENNYRKLRRYIEKNIQKLSSDPHMSVSKFMFEIEE